MFLCTWVHYPLKIVVQIKQSNAELGVCPAVNRLTNTWKKRGITRNTKIRVMRYTISSTWTSSLENDREQMSWEYLVVAEVVKNTLYSDKNKRVNKDRSEHWQMPFMLVPPKYSFWPHLAKMK